MNEQARDTTTDTGPVLPEAPDVSGFGGGRRQRRTARLVAAAQRGGSPSGVPGTPPGGNAQVEADYSTASKATRDQKVPEQQAASPELAAVAAESESATTAPTKPAVQAGSHGAAAEPADDAASKQAAPVEGMATATIHDDPPAAEPLSAEGKDAVRTDTVGAGEAEPPAVVEGSPAIDPSEDTPPPASEVVDEDPDEHPDKYAQFPGGKVTLQAYVPDLVAKKFQQMQTTGPTAELIVLTSVRNCAHRIPQLIEKARGPVHKDGLFSGLPVLDRKPGRKAEAKPNSSRVQYQVEPRWLPELNQLAKKHNLKLSVLIRLALGDFFSVPVRFGRKK